MQPKSYIEANKAVCSSQKTIDQCEGLPFSDQERLRYWLATGKFDGGLAVNGYQDISCSQRATLRQIKQFVHLKRQ